MEVAMTWMSHCSHSLSLRDCNLPVWSPVLPLWAAWKIHQAFPLESVWIRQQALQWKHTRHVFINQRLATQMLCLQKRKTTAVTFFFFSFFFKCCRSGQAHTVCRVQTHAHTHTHISPSWFVKSRRTVAFSVKAFHTAGARPDLYCVWEWEQLVVSGAIPAGGTVDTVYLCACCPAYCQEA